jgi:hypothetical protein
VLGKNVTQVARAFGRPDVYHRDASVGFLRYGPARSFALLVLFRSGAAVSFASQDPALVVAKAGRLLTLRPAAMQRRIATAYTGVLRLSEPYRCDGSTCAGRFEAVSGRLAVMFGLAGGAPFVSVSRT